MIKYIKEYGITDRDYEYIIKNTPQYILDTFILSEYNVREVLNYYNSLGLTESLATIIINRPDLVIINKDYIEELVTKIGEKVFYNMVKASIDDLILLGI